MKNAVVVVLLLGVAYGAYQVINAPDPDFNLDPETLATVENGIELEIPDLDLPEFSDSNADTDNFEANSTDAPSSATPLSFGAPPTTPRLNDPGASSNLNPPSLTPPALDSSDSRSFQPNVDSAAPSDSQNKVGGSPGFGSFDNSKDTSASGFSVESDSSNFGATNAEQGAGKFNPQPTTNLVDISPRQPESGYQSNPYAQSKQAGQPDRAPSTNSNFTSGGPDESGSNSGVSRSNILDENDASKLLEPVASTVDWDQLNRLCESQDYRTALKTLSQFHRANPNSNQRTQVLEWLDALSFKVIFSNEHNLADGPYTVQQGESLVEIADRWNVPVELVYKVNQAAISSPDVLIPGTQLKMISGPFDAEIDPKTRELTLYLGDMYATRFQVEMGNDAQIRPGVMKVNSKSDRGRAYKDQAGQTYAVNDPSNPYGQFWLGLDEQTCLHSVTNVADNRGCIRLTPEDAADVYNILSNESQVIIR